MIQRIQTIYLFLAFVCIVLCIFFPLFSVQVSTDFAQSTAEFGAYGFVTDGLPGAELGAIEMPVYIVFIFLALFTLAAIFLYKKRKRQLMVTRLSMIFHFLAAAGVYAFYYIGRSFLAENIELPDDQTATVKLAMMPGFYFLVSTIPLLLLAIRGIKRDEMLVKSLDRLR